ncbi:MAG TPA: hypothetical protein VH352_17170 [Pseudonocardiaceae bacterium]|nr:hypothetical protein [Pseudonocardiaceae bacterium]
MPDQRRDRRGPGGYRTSVLGRVDWSCWLAAAGFLFLTVVAVAIQFAVLGVFTALLAVGLVAFDSWVNRPDGNRRPAGRRPMGQRFNRDTGRRDDYADSGVEQWSRPAPPPPMRAPGRPAQGRPAQGRPVPQGRPVQGRPAQGRPVPQGQNYGGGFRPNPPPPPQQPGRQPYRPAPQNPPPGRGR